MVVRQSAFALVFLTLICFKVASAALHIHFHHNDHHHCGDHENHGNEEDEQCELCDEAIYTQLLEFSSTSDFTIPEGRYLSYFRQPDNPYNGLFCKASLGHKLYVRPPPFIV